MARITDKAQVQGGVIWAIIEARRGLSLAVTLLGEIKGQRPEMLKISGQGASPAFLHVREAEEADEAGKVQYRVSLNQQLLAELAAFSRETPFCYLVVACGHKGYCVVSFAELGRCVNLGGRRGTLRISEDGGWKVCGELNEGEPLAVAKNRLTTLA